jgi:hypothetical protein
MPEISEWTLAALETKLMSRVYIAFSTDMQLAGRSQLARPRVVR